jgi:glycosyltransferase involved in cell wall biosynthesis
MKCSAIIPCYNEERRILPVVKTIKGSHLFDQIIIVDDGSNQSTKKVLSRIKHIHLITHLQNQGKSQALKSGLLQASNDIVVFLDSDLKNLNKQHLLDLTNPLLSGNYDMVIGDPCGVWWPFVVLGYSANISGQRAFLKKLMLQHLEVFDHQGFLKGYLVELSINRVFYSRHRVGKILLKDLSNYYKIDKTGLSGFINDLKVLYHFINFLGLKEYLSQLNFIRRLPYLNQTN